MSNEEEKKVSITYKTKDLNFASFLWAQPGVELQNLIHSKGIKEVYFVFLLTAHSEEDLNQLHLNYANNKTLIEPNLFTEKQRGLKDLLYRVIKTNKEVRGE